MGPYPQNKDTLIPDKKTDSDTKESNVTKMRLTKNNATKIRLALHREWRYIITTKNIVTINN